MHTFVCMLLHQLNHTSSVFFMTGIKVLLSTLRTLWIVCVIFFANKEEISYNIVFHFLKHSLSKEFLICCHYYSYNAKQKDWSNCALKGLWDRWLEGYADRLVYVLRFCWNFHHKEKKCSFIIKDTLPIKTLDTLD